MFDISEHGGHCCGVQHLHNFYNENASYATVTGENISHLKDVIESFDEEFEDNSGGYGALEVVLNLFLMDLGWDKVLQDLGFEKLYSWINGNTENECTLFMYHCNSGKRLDAKDV